MKRVPAIALLRERIVDLEVEECRDHVARYDVNHWGGSGVGL
jgi:hypothetical protein